MTFYKGIGCKACDFSGYAGRTLISEIFEVTRDVALALSRGAGEKELKRLAMEGGMKTMIDDGMMKMNQTTLSELIRVVPVEMIKEFAARQKGVMIWDDDESGDLRKIVITDPENQKEMIDRLYVQYVSFHKDNAALNTAPQKKLFREFITDSYFTVKKKYACNSVGFYIEDSDDGVSLSAAPEKEQL